MPLNRTIAHTVPDSALEFRFVQARGPGGQHVNKAATGVELRVTVAKLGLAHAAEVRLRTQQSNRINKDGVLVIQADQFRSQLANRKAALARLQDYLRTALQPRKRRVATKPSAAARKRRLDRKKQRSTVKVNRRKPGLD